MLPHAKPRKLKVFGSVAYSLIVPKAARTGNLKLPGSVGWFIGYSDNSDGYMIFDPIEGKCKVRRDVLFDQRWRYNGSGVTITQLLEQERADRRMKAGTCSRHLGISVPRQNTPSFLLSSLCAIFSTCPLPNVFWLVKVGNTFRLITVPIDMTGNKNIPGNALHGFCSISILQYPFSCVTATVVHV